MMRLPFHPWEEKYHQGSPQLGQVSWRHAQPVDMTAAVFIPTKVQGAAFTMHESQSQTLHTEVPTCNNVRVAGLLCLKLLTGLGSLSSRHSVLALSISSGNPAACTYGTSNVQSACAVDKSPQSSIGKCLRVSIAPIFVLQGDYVHVMRICCGCT